MLLPGPAGRYSSGSQQQAETLLREQVVGHPPVGSFGSHQQVLKGLREHMPKLERLPSREAKDACESLWRQPLLRIVVGDRQENHYLLCLGADSMESRTDVALEASEVPAK